VTASDQCSSSAVSCRWQSRYFRLVFSVMEVQIDASQTARAHCQRCRTEVQAERQQQHEVILTQLSELFHTTEHYSHSLVVWSYSVNTSTVTSTSMLYCNCTIREFTVWNRTRAVWRVLTTAKYWNAFYVSLIIHVAENSMSTRSDVEGCKYVKRCVVFSLCYLFVSTDHTVTRRWVMYVVFIV